MAGDGHPFYSLYTHGFARVAVGIPRVEVASPAFNAERVIALARRASEAGSAVALFPECALSAYTNQDLFHQDALLDATLEALERVVAASAEWTPVVVVGAPLRFAGGLYNCAAVIHRGRLLGVAPKTYLPTYREYYEARHFVSARAACFDSVRLLGEEVPFGADLVFAASDLAGLAIHAEICEDLWVPAPPSSFAALAGATVLCNPAATNATVAKAEYRRLLCASQSGRCIAAYLYAGSGVGESTTDLAWDGHGMVWEGGRLLAESERFATDDQLVLADVDLNHLVQERMRTTSFHDAAADSRERVARVRRVEFELAPPAVEGPLMREVRRHPFVPQDPARRDERCREVYQIQVQGLAQRLRATGIEKVVIGVSGGLDSTQALIVSARAIDQLGLPRTNVLAYTLPGFATSERTRSNAWRLMRALGVSAAEIDVRPSARQMLADLGHPAARGEAVYDVTYENVQAGERTSHLFRLANQHGALVVGTGDLSELALGWCTYGVGDHMSHYGVNASVPKTLIRYLVRWEAGSGEVDEETAEVLLAVADTAISPELVPEEDGAEPRPRTEEVVGPFDLQDFNLYYLTRYGYRPSKIAFLAYHAWSDGGPTPPAGGFDLAAIKRWLEVFLRRFAANQFKRSALPDGPKVGSGGSLSPRGDWRMPSDAGAGFWLDELERKVPGGEESGEEG